MQQTCSLDLGRSTTKHREFKKPGSHDDWAAEMQLVDDCCEEYIRVDALGARDAVPEAGQVDCYGAVPALSRELQRISARQIGRAHV